MSSQIVSDPSIVSDPGLLSDLSLYCACPPRGPKNRHCQKWYFDGFWPSQLTCPKSCQKVSKKWSKNGLGKIWGQKTGQKVVKKLSKMVFWQIEVAAFGRHPKRGRARFARAPPFWALFAKKPFFDHFLGSLLPPDLAEAIFGSLFDYFLGRSFGKARTIPGPLFGHFHVWAL